MTTLKSLKQQDDIFNRNLARKVSKNKKTVVFDIDDTIANFSLDLLDLLNKVLKKSYSIDDITDLYNIHKHFDLSFDKFKEILKKNYFYENQRLNHPEVPMWFRSARNKGLKVHIISNRLSVHENAQELTEKWLMSYNLHFDKFTALESSVLKPSIFDSSVIAFYDDNEKHLNAALNLKIPFVFQVQGIPNKNSSFPNKIYPQDMWKHILQLPTF